MGNPVHLLLQVLPEPLDHVGASYLWLLCILDNTKYQRVRNLFHDHFRSEPANADSGLLLVQRYIHQILEKNSSFGLLA